MRVHGSPDLDSTPTPGIVGDIESPYYDYIYLHIKST